MNRIFKFSGEKPIVYDDIKSVKELIQYSFHQFNYYEPAGMEIVTVFQPQSRTYTGWFTTDTSLSCKEEIEDAENLCFAYHMPMCFILTKEDGDIICCIWGTILILMIQFYCICD